MDHPIATLWHSLADQDNPPILELLNIERKPVGAIYLDRFRYKNFVISETTSSEKYYLYVDGLGIYFSFYQKISS